MNTLELVQEFHEAFGHRVDADISYEQLSLRRSLIAEEASEVIRAITDLNTSLAFGTRKNQRADLAHLMKELADLQYVLDGAFVEMGIDKDEVFLRVHESNMSKLGEDGRPLKNAVGKTVKGPNYKEPDLSDLAMRLDNKL